MQLLSISLAVSALPFLLALLLVETLHTGKLDCL